MSIFKFYNTSLVCPGEPAWFAQAVAAAAAPAVAAAVAAAIAPLTNEITGTSTRAAFASEPPQPLKPLLRAGPAPNAPPALTFPGDTQEFLLWTALGAARAGNNTRIDSLLDFYRIVDPVTGGLFPAVTVLAAGAAGDDEMLRKHEIQRTF
jgi:hypothetical protein